MKETENLIYEVFLRELIESDIDVLEDSYRALLIGEEYKPNKNHLLKDILPYSVPLKTYDPLESNLNKFLTESAEIFLEEDNLNKLTINAKGSVQWYDLTFQPKNSSRFKTIKAADGSIVKNYIPEKAAYVLIVRCPKKIESLDYNNPEGSADAGVIPVMCQNFEKPFILEHEDLKLTWPDFFLQFIQLNPIIKENPDDKIPGALGSFILGANRLNSEEL